MLSLLLKLLCTLVCLTNVNLWAAKPVVLNPKYTGVELHDDERWLGTGKHGRVSLGQATLYERDGELSTRTVVIKRPIAVRIQSCGSLFAEYEVLLNLSQKSASFAEPIAIVDQEGDGCGLVMEYGGRTLAQLVDEGGVFSPREVLSIGYQLAQALHILMMNGVCHNDLKPANIVIREGIIKIIDLGSARFNDREYVSSPIYTPIFAAPELIKGEACPKADMFSTGLVLYFLMTGKYLQEEMKGHPFAHPLAGAWFMACSGVAEGASSYLSCYSQSQCAWNCVPDITPYGDPGEGLRDFVKRMTHPDPHSRPSYAEVLDFFAIHRT